MVRSPGPYIFLRRISLTVCDCQQIPSKYCGLHHIPKNHRKFKADWLSYLYSVIITQQRVDAYNKRLDVFGDPPSTHPLSEVLGFVSDILNFENFWQDWPIANQTHSFSNIINLYHILLIVYWIVMKNKSSELTRLDWVGIRLNQFGMFENVSNCYQDENNVVSTLNPRVVWKPWINSENIKSLELTV